VDSRRKGPLFLNRGTTERRVLKHRPLNLRRRRTLPRYAFNREQGFGMVWSRNMSLHCRKFNQDCPVIQPAA